MRAKRKVQPVPADPGLAGADEEEEEIYRDREYNAMIAPSIVNGRRVLFVNMEGLFMPVSPVT